MKERKGKSSAPIADRHLVDGSLQDWWYLRFFRVDWRVHFLLFPFRSCFFWYQRSIDYAKNERDRERERERERDSKRRVGRGWGGRDSLVDFRTTTSVWQTWFPVPYQLRISMTQSRDNYLCWYGLEFSGTLSTFCWGFTKPLGSTVINGTLRFSGIPFEDS